MDKELSVIDSVIAMLETFTEVSDVCLALDITEQELDKMCREKFNMSIEQTAERCAARGRAKIHAVQVAAALDGDRSMLLLLGKQYLGQTDKPTVIVTKKKETPLDRAQSKRANAADRKSKTNR